MFAKIDTLVASPGCCFLCGSGMKPPYIDFGTSIDYYGAVILCHECMEAAGAMLGMLTFDKHSAALQELDSLKDQVESLQYENSALRNAIEEINLANFHSNEMMVVLDFNRDNYTISGAVSTVASILEDSEDSDKVLRDSTELLDSGEGENDESSNDEGVDELRSDESESTDFKFRL
jgi:hypothetical protein